MGVLTDSNGKSNGLDMIELTGKIMVLATILLFFLLLFLLSHHLYARLLRQHHQQTTTAAATTTTRRRRRLDFAAGHEEIILVPCTLPGLDPAILQTIPIVTLDRNHELIDELECAVCLCDVCEGEKARILPKCNHGFHVECIDMWFHSHSTCPLCRNPVSIHQKLSNDESSAILDDVMIQAPLMAENLTEAPRMVVIDIPGRSD